MAFRIGDVGLDASTDGLVDTFDVGSGTATGIIEIYTGSQPATPATSATGTKLITVDFNNPAFGDSSAGSAHMITTPTVQAFVSANGTAGWFRMKDRDGHAICDGSVTLTGMGGDITFDDVDFIAGGRVVFFALTVQHAM